MKRILLTLAFCSPLLFSIPSVQSVELIGPNGETQSSSEQYGPVPASETLWAISNKLKPSNNVSVYQTLVAIYKSNPNAFNKGNINGIIPGSVLNVPSEAFIAQQTNKEAYDLLKPAKPVVKKVSKPVVVEPVKPEQTVTPKEVMPVAPEVDPEILNTLKKEISDRDTALETSDKLISEQEKELLLLNEQLLVLTEKNQVLKLKLQPLSDQISMLSEQVEEELSIQAELQALIAEYKSQIDSFVEPPFSGEGLINEIFRTIASSITSVLVAILTPLLLLAAIVVLLMRLKSKRELAIQEQEMAESTAILMEQQSGKFDSLLTDDLEGDDNLENDIDFAGESDLEPTLDTEPTQEQTIIKETPSATGNDLEVDIVDDGSDIISLDDETTPPLEEFEELEATEDDPFGIGALVEEELVVDLDSGADTESAADDVFDIDALIAGSEETIELSDDDLSASEESNQADLDLAAEWESQLASESDLESDATVELPSDVPETPDKEQAAEELAELEALLDSEPVDETKDEVIEDIDALLETEEPANEIVDDIDALLETEEPTNEVVEDIDALLEAEEPANEVVDDIDALLEAEEPANEVVEDIDALLEAEEPANEVVEDIDALLEAEEPANEVVEDIDALLETEEPANEVVEDIDALLESEESADEVSEDIDALLESEESVNDVVDDIDALLEAEEPADEVVEDIDALLAAETDETSVDDVPSNEEVTDLSEFENIDISTLKNVDEVMSALDEEDSKEHDLLTKQLTEGAFNEDVPLPSVEKVEDDGFIDIDTLLEDTDNEEVTEDEFNLELGLEEFPDVVESFAEFDTDDSGIAAQLDLARAYLEIDEKNGAKGILTALLDTAKDDQLTEVQKLLNRIK